MTTGGAFVPEDVIRFVLTSIPSVPYLEAMLLLRERADQAWDAARLAQRLYLGEKAAGLLLEELHAAGVLREDAQLASCFRYDPGSEELGRMIDRLAAAYAAHLVTVTHLIHSKTGKKAQQFADAFILRKET